MNEYKKKVCISFTKLKNFDDDEQSVTYENQLYDFFNLFQNAINDEDREKLNGLMQLSFEFVGIKESSALPIFCFDNNVASCFIKSFQKEYYQSLFKYSIHIFYNIYIAKFCSDLEYFFPTRLFEHLWNCFSFVNNDECLMIIQIIKETMAQSPKSFQYINNMLKIDKIYSKLSVRIQDCSYFQFLIEYLYTLTNENQNLISELDFFMFYLIIIDVFNFFRGSFENQDPNIQFHKETVLKLIKSFNKIVLIDGYCENRKMYQQIMNDFFLSYFIFINDMDIYFYTIRTLSSLCDHKYILISREADINTTKKKKHIFFDIFVSNEDIYTKLLNDLCRAIEIPDNSPYNDIPGHLCNIITRFSKQILNGQIISKLHEHLLPNVFYQFILNKTVIYVTGVIKTRDISSKLKACKLAILMLEGKIGLIRQMLNFGIISDIASFFETDDVILMYSALKFFYKLADLRAEVDIEYPLEIDIQRCNLIGFLDQILLNTDEKERYKDILPKVELTKASIIKNILADDQE